MIVRIVTANLFRGRVDPSTLVDLIRDLEPDVLAVQELLPAAAAVISSELPHGELDLRPAGPSIGLALRRPAVVERLALMSHDALVAVLEPGEWNGLRQTLEITAVHLTNPLQLPPWRTYRKRFGDVRVLAADAARPRAGGRVLVGDLNSPPPMLAYRKLRRYFVDGVEVAAARNGSRPDRTWGPWPRSPRVARIDHVLVSNVEVVATHTVDVEGSDHDAVVVDIDM
jgi:endonuclease/exonuclease/phosphatase family metal-dependent hydrolase